MSPAKHIGKHAHAKATRRDDRGGGREGEHTNARTCIVRTRCTTSHVHVRCVLAVVVAAAATAAVAADATQSMCLFAPTYMPITFIFSAMTACAVEHRSLPTTANSNKRAPTNERVLRPRYLAKRMRDQVPVRLSPRVQGVFGLCWHLLHASVNSTHCQPDRNASNCMSTKPREFP